MTSLFVLKGKHPLVCFSQGDMLANVLSVGAKQTRLLEKTEELTLYLIEEENEHQSLNFKLQSLNMKYDLLENRQTQSADGKRKKRKKRRKDKKASFQVLTHYKNMPDSALPLRYSADLPPAVEGTNMLTPQNSHP